MFHFRVNSALFSSLVGVKIFAKRTIGQKLISPRFYFKSQSSNIKLGGFAGINDAIS
jgi:hypothetical protein